MIPLNVRENWLASKNVLTLNENHLHEIAEILENFRHYITIDVSYNNDIWLLPSYYSQPNILMNTANKRYMLAILPM